MTAPDVDAMLTEEGPAAVQAELDRLRRLVEGQAKELRRAIAQWGEQERRAEAAEAELAAQAPECDCRTRADAALSKLLARGRIDGRDRDDIHAALGGDDGE